uniref:Uncharacterized protein n=2 Tax=Cacopsylla melanoneura TaxID=428564 RepID=A0A8D8T058_9HEMI
MLSNEIRTLFSKATFDLLTELGEDYEYEFLEFFESNKDEGVVYFITNSDLEKKNIYIVGCTSFIDIKLQQSNDLELFDKYYVKFSYETKDKFKALELAHEYLDEFCIRDELFKITKKDIFDTMNYISLNENDNNNMDENNNELEKENPLKYYFNLMNNIR